MVKGSLIIYNEIAINSDNYNNVYALGTITNDDTLLSIKFDDFVDKTSEEVKSALSGVMLYYELAEPELIDIPDILQDDNLIETEVGGHLTFKNQHGIDYRIPVPSEVEYMINVEEAL